MNYKKIANKGILTLTPFQPGKPIEELERELGIRNIIKLASNENPLGPSTKAIAAAKKACESMNMYPDAHGFELKQNLSKTLKVEPKQLALGNGSDDLLHSIGNVFIQPQQEVILSQYAFVSYPIIALKYGGVPIVVPANNWAHDLEAMPKAITNKTKLIYLANPNNPTGTCFTENELANFLQKVPENIIVVIDEAYFEYMQDFPNYPDSLKLQQQFKNLIITRTFSKAYGLAGLRVGYAIAHANIIELINRARLPFNVNSVAMKAATAALKDQIHIRKSIKLNNEGREYLQQKLSKMELDIISNAGNFITIDLKQSGKNVFSRLLRKGIITRPLANYDMPRHLRISIGLPAQNKSIAEALSDLLA